MITRHSFSESIDVLRTSAKIETHEEVFKNFEVCMEAAGKSAPKSNGGFFSKFRNDEDDGMFLTSSSKSVELIDSDDEQNKSDKDKTKDQKNNTTTTTKVDNLNTNKIPSDLVKENTERENQNGNDGPNPRVDFKAVYSRIEEAFKNGAYSIFFLLCPQPSDV